MATTVGSRVDYSDLRNWYNTFNNLANNFSNGITALTVPANDAHAVRATEINNLHA